MHHVPAGPSLLEALAAALRRWAVPLRRLAGLGRVLPGTAVALAVVPAVVWFSLVAPPASRVPPGSGGEPAALASSSSAPVRAPEDPAPSSPARRGVEGVVTMGVDGAPAPRTTDGAPASATTPPPPPEPVLPATAPPPADPTPAEPGTPAIAPPVAAEPVAPSATTSASVPASPDPAPVTTAGAPADVTGAPAGASREEDVRALLDEARAAGGCAPLTADPALAAVAREHSAAVAAPAPDAPLPVERAHAAGLTTVRVGDVATGAADAAAAGAAWLADGPTRTRLLDCGLRTLGVGVVEGPGGPWWTVLLGS